MQVKRTHIPGVVCLVPPRSADSRGHFVETYSKRSLAEVGIAADFVQDNQSFSAQAGTIRGLHFQLPPTSQAKLVRVVRGRVYDVVVDLRLGSPTFGLWAAETLTAHCGEQLYVPRGLAHGFCSLEPGTEVAYKVDNYYAPEYDSGLVWNDPDLAIDWPVPPQDVVLSDKDRKLGRLADFTTPFRYDGCT
jgi:dTDP-4-dehydrorhamnose 3,5-epimerase